MTGTTARHDHYVHDALLFACTEDLVEATTGFLREGLEDGQGVLLVCTDENNRALRSALGEHERVISLARREVYRRAATAVTYYRGLMGRISAAGVPRVRLVGEVAFATDPAGREQWRRFEAVCNQVLAPHALWSVCAYDTSTLPGSLLATAEATHPFLRRDGRRLPNPGYVDPVRLLEPATHDLDPARTGAPALVLEGVREPGRPRRRLRELLAGHRAAPAAVDDLVQASTELVTNALRHGLPPVTLRAWTGSGRVVCTVTDRGAGFADPFAGYQPGVSDDLLEGRFGLWLVRQLCDDMVATHGDDGFSVGIALDVR